MDSHYRTLHYVEVIYLTRMQPINLKVRYYPEAEASRVFSGTVKKLKEEGISALINLREENHNLLKSEFSKMEIIKKKKIVKF
jgi:hypothetical protein